MLWLKRLQLFLNRASVQHGLQGLLLKVVTVRLLAVFNWIDIQLHTCLLFASLPLAVALWLQRAGSRKSGLAIKCSLCRVVLVDQCATCSAAVGPKCQRTDMMVPHGAVPYRFWRQTTAALRRKHPKRCNAKCDPMCICSKCIQMLDIMAALCANFRLRQLRAVHPAAA